MDEVQIAVSLTLRDTETCTAAADVWDESQISTVSQPRDQRRVLAVVTHRSLNADVVNGEEGASNEREDGCLFVMKYRSPSSYELYPYLFFPIMPELTASLTRVNDGTSSFNTSEFTLSLKNSRGTIVLGSNEKNSLTTVLEESTRLKKLVDTVPLITTPAVVLDSPEEPSPAEDIETKQRAVDQSDDSHPHHWEWLHFYLSHKASRILPSQKPKPDDIRSVVNGPRLSESSAGLPADEDGDIALIRDHWLRRQFSLLKGEYSQTVDIRLRIGTFNVNDKPPSQNLACWLRGSSSGSSPGTVRTSLEVNPPKQSEIVAQTEVLAEPAKKFSAEVERDTLTSAEDASSTTESTVISSIALTSSNDTPLPSTPPSSVSSGDCEDLPDVFVLGFQELDLSTEALLYSTSTLKADAWIAAVFDALGKNANDYVHLVHRQLVGVLVIVIIRKELQSIVEEVSTASAGVGIMGIMGNKGATAVRLRLYSTTVTFVCSHLAAFDEYVDKRNSDFAEICRKLQFPVTWKGTRGMSSITASIWETDVLFWLGDLNYRIDLPDQEVRTFLASKPQCRENDTLLAYDQLKTTARQRRAFTDFIEHPITFLPTYRFSDPPLDGLGYDLKRRPAWTDRILYLATDRGHVSQMSYESHPQITLSDHRPVSAEFKLRLERNGPHELQRVAISLFKQLGDFEDSATTPNVTLLDGTEIDLGYVSYPRVVSRTITVKNQGEIACAFRFIPLEPGSSISKEWLKVEPICGILLPQESEAIRLTTNLDKRIASFLNHGNMKLEDSLILHLVKGTDHLITVSGSYQPTCFANSLAWLVRSPGPIRGDGNPQLLPPANTLSAPRELMFLVEWLITNAHDMNDLFVTRGDESLVDMIRMHLDTRPLNSEETISFPEGTDKRAIAMAFADTMLQFLESLTEPMIPWILHPRCALAGDREDVFEILDHVPGFARNVYVTVTAFLHFIGHSGPDRPAELAKIFANVLLPDDPRAPPGIPPLTPLGKRNFLLYTIS